MTCFDEGLLGANLAAERFDGRVVGASVGVYALRGDGEFGHEIVHDLVHVFGYAPTDLFSP